MAESLATDTTDPFVMTSPEYDDWLQCIIDDDTEKASDVMKAASPEERDRLLNGRFRSYTPSHQKAWWVLVETPRHITLTRPLSIAVVYGSLGIVDLLSREGADTACVEENGDNAFHTLVKAAAIDIANEGKYRDTLVQICRRLPEDTLAACLLSEDVDKLRPLEIASLHGTFLVQQAIMETSLYCVNKKHFGAYVLEYYDVTEYEAMPYDVTNRRYKSPVKLMVQLENSRLAAESTQDCFMGEPMRSWFKKKSKMNIPFLVLWCAFRTAFACLFFKSNMEIRRPAGEVAGLDVSAANITNVSAEITTMCNAAIKSTSATNHIMVYALITMCCMMLLVDVADLVIYLFFTPLWTKKSGKSLVLHFKFYRVVQTILAISVMILAICYLFNERFHNYIPLEAEHTLYVFAASCSIWSLLYFIQLVPWLGYYIVAVQRMMMAFAQFAILFALFMLSYIFVFRRIILDTDGGCPEEFESTTSALYSTFLVMVNMLEINEFHVINEWGLYVLHIIYVFMVGVLLINFLIAIMTDEYADVSDNRQVISSIQMLHVTSILEQRLAWLLAPVYMVLRWRYFKTRDGSVYLMRLVMRERDKFTEGPHDET